MQYIYVQNKKMTTKSLIDIW